MDSRKNARMGITIALCGAGVVIALMAGVLVPAILSAAPGTTDTAVSSPVMEHGEQAPAVMDHAMMACDFTNLVGMTTEEATAKIDEAGRPVRVLAPNGAATMDHSPARVNLMVDDKGVVLSVTCG